MTQEDKKPNEEQESYGSEAMESVSEYDGMKFDEIATILNDISMYNNNYYKLPNGIVVFVHTDEFYEVSEMFVVNPENPKDKKSHVHVGYLESNSTDFCDRVKLTTEVYT